MFIDKASRFARHAVAALITFAGITGVWFVLWTLLSILVILLGKMSLATYVGGVFLVLVGVVPALAVVIPAVLLAERVTAVLGPVRYVAQFPIVIGLTFLMAVGLLLLSAVLSWLISPRIMEYAGLSVFMALPIAIVYWLTAKCVEFGIESVRETLSLIFAGLRGAIDLVRYLRSGEVIRRDAPAAQTPPATVTVDTPRSTPLPGPEARGR